ncbi:MAG: hypothetical protein JRI92_07550 [Deltaproteobacteria bacterium]|nr:hypothetical protein [Deltaproteobacteria bacterium]
MKNKLFFSVLLVILTLALVAMAEEKPVEMGSVTLVEGTALFQGSTSKKIEVGNEIFNLDVITTREGKLEAEIGQGKAYLDNYTICAFALDEKKQTMITIWQGKIAVDVKVKGVKIQTLSGQEAIPGEGFHLYEVQNDQLSIKTNVEPDEFLNWCHAQNSKPEAPAQTTEESTSAYRGSTAYIPNFRLDYYGHRPYYRPYLPWSTRRYSAFNRYGMSRYGMNYGFGMPYYGFNPLNPLNWLGAGLYGMMMGAQYGMFQTFWDLPRDNHYYDSRYDSRYNNDRSYSVSSNSLRAPQSSSTQNQSTMNTQSTRSSSQKMGTQSTSRSYPSRISRNITRSTSKSNRNAGIAPASNSRNRTVTANQSTRSSRSVRTTARSTSKNSRATVTRSTRSTRSPQISTQSSSRNSRSVRATGQSTTRSISRSSRATVARSSESARTTGRSTRTRSSGRVRKR